MQKILIIIESLGLGGSERALGYLLPALKARGLICEVAALWPPYDFAESLEAAEIKVHRLNVSAQLNAVGAVRAIVKLIRKGDYRIVQANSFFAALYTALSGVLEPGVNRVVTFHDLSYESYPANNWKRRILKAANRFLLTNFFDGYVAVSTAVAQHYLEHLGLRHITVIPNAIPEEVRETALERSTILARYGVKENCCVLLMAARFVHEKGHRFLLQALEILRANGVTPHTLLFGNGPLYQEIGAAICASALDDQVTTSSAISHEELLGVMQAADVFVLTSTHEGFGLAAAEAMLLGKPVVATDVGGLPDLIEHNVSGILVPAEKPELLAEALERLIANPQLRAALGEAGRLRVLSLFGLEAVVPQWEHFYAGLEDETALKEKS